MSLWVYIYIYKPSVYVCVQSTIGGTSKQKASHTHGYTHTYTCTHIHTHMHTYIRTYIHIHIFRCNNAYSCQ